MTHRFFLGLTLGITIGFGVANAFFNDHMKKQAVKHNCAEYSPTTGEWAWKE